MRSALLKPVIDRSYPTVAYGSGVYLYDTDGNQYLDGSCGAMTANIGHGVAEVADAMQQQAERVAFSYRTQFTNEPAELLADRLTSLAPGALNHAFLVNSGSEASEYAIRAAVGYWREFGLPNKTKILGRHISYHGMTMGALSLSGHPARRPDYGSLLHAFPVAPPAYAYRFANEGESEDEYAERAAAEFEQAIVDEDPDTVAAMIVEPIVGAAGGVLVPPRGYLAKLREICDRQGILFIVDEVITGFGRTGNWFASEYECIVPDMLLFGKGASAGYAPVAGVLLHDRVVEAFGTHSGVVPFGHTFSANPLGAATCLAVLGILKRDRGFAHVKARGAQLSAGLQALAERYSIMADVRGRGLLWGFELVVDHATKQTPDPALNANALLVDECFAQGLVIYPAGIAPLNNAVIVSPPLVISEAEVEGLLVKLDRALERVTPKLS